MLIQGVIAAVLLLSAENSGIMISGTVLPIVAGIMALVVTVAAMGVSFEQAIRFGQTRRRALGMELGRSLFMGVCSMGMAALLTALEHMVSPVLWLKLTGLPGLSLEGISPMPEPSLGAPVDPAWESTLFIEDFSLNWWCGPPFWSLLYPAASLSAQSCSATAPRVAGSSGVSGWRPVLAPSWWVETPISSAI